MCDIYYPDGLGNKKPNSQKELLSKNMKMLLSAFRFCPTITLADINASTNDHLEPTEAPKLYKDTSEVNEPKQLTDMQSYLENLRKDRRDKFQAKIRPGLDADYPCKEGVKPDDDYLLKDEAEQWVKKYMGDTFDQADYDQISGEWLQSKDGIVEVVKSTSKNEAGEELTEKKIFNVIRKSWVGAQIIFFMLHDDVNYERKAPKNKEVTKKEEPKKVDVEKPEATAVAAPTK